MKRAFFSAGHLPAPIACFARPGKARGTEIVIQLVVILGLVVAWLFDIDSLAQLLVLGCVPSVVAVVSFAIVLPMFAFLGVRALAAWARIAAVPIRWRYDAAMLIGACA